MKAKQPETGEIKSPCINLKTPQQMKRYIILRNSIDLNKPQKQKEIRQHLTSGVLTNNLLLQMQFISTDKVINEILENFRIMKNRIAQDIRGEK